MIEVVAGIDSVARMGELVVSGDKLLGAEEEEVEMLVEEEEKQTTVAEEETTATESRGEELKGLMRWEKFLPKMVLRVLLVEADDSTRQIIAALLRKCSYKGLITLFLSFFSLISCFFLLSTTMNEFPLFLFLLFHLLLL